MTVTTDKWTLSPHRCFDADPARRQVATELYEGVKGLPLVCPHGHIDPFLLAEPNARFASPAGLFVIPDHYIIRMLYSQGVGMEKMGLATRDGSPTETDGRAVWRRFAERFYLFDGTPSGLWLKTELIELFGIDEKPSAANAERLYDQIEARLAEPDFSPRALFRRFNIEVLSTTDAATDDLAHHRSLHAEGWTMIRPTLRPDAVVDILSPGWRAGIDRLSAVSGVNVADHRSFIAALEARRAEFKRLGGFATDHSAISPRAERLTEQEASAIFERALRGRADQADRELFSAHMLMELARMAAEDGLVMQLHCGSLRDYNGAVSRRFGRDVGADIPVAFDWTRNLRPLLDEFGNDPRFRLVLYTVDETTLSREMAPLAGHYPTVFLGAPWWFYDSPNGMERFLDAVVETAGIYNLAGFNDDTRAFPSIATRHDVWRRVTCNWIAGKVVRGLIDEADAPRIAGELAYGCGKRTYRLA